MAMEEDVTEYGSESDYSTEEEEPLEDPNSVYWDEEEDLDNVDESNLTAEEKKILKEKRKARRQAEAERKAAEAEQRKADNAAYRLQRKAEREQEEVDAEKAKVRKANLKANQSQRRMDRNLIRQQLVKDEAEDRRKRFDFLLNSTGGDLFRKFIEESSSVTKDGTVKKLIAELMESSASKGGRAKKSGAAGGRRGLMKEAEEDKLIMKAQQRSIEACIQFTESPKYVEGGTMRDYQIRGLNWMVDLDSKGLNGILADEMGLGKTLQTISLIGYIKHYQNNQAPCLVVVPKAVIQNWKGEFKKWVPSLKTILLIGNKDERAKQVEEELEPGDWDVCVTTYEVCILEKAAFRKFHFRYICIDEAHRLKNEKSKLSETIRTFDCRNRLLITGTPLQNNLHELWALLNYILPDVFGSDEDFGKWFNSNEDGVQKEMVTKLHTLLKPFMLRRLKADVEASLLPKKETKVYVGLSQMQREWYTKILKNEIEVINGAGKQERMRLLNILMQLRKNCNHPYLFDGAEKMVNGRYDPDLMHLVKNSGKMMILDKLLTKVQAQGSRVLIFSQMTRMLDILEDYFLWRQHKYFRLDGNTNHIARQDMIEAYNAPDSEYFIFMLSTRAGGLGINLYTADVVILYDSDWNPQMDLQAQDRAHRIGQKKQVRVFRFVTEDTVEERIVQKAEVKLRMDALVIQSGRLADKDRKLGANEMVNMIQFGAQKMFKSKDATVTDDDIDAILDISEKKTAEGMQKLESLGDLDSLKSFTFDTQPEKGLRDFEGEVHTKESVTGGVLPFGLIDIGKRERKAVSYSADQRFNEISAASQARQMKAPRPPQKHKVEDYQFYPSRLAELLDQEVLAFRRKINYRVPKDNAKEGGWTKEDEEGRKEEQARIDNTEPLTEEEEAEKTELLTQGFHDWNKRDYQQFCKACEKYGRDDVTSISKEVDSKDPVDVIKYHEVFWGNEKRGIAPRYTEINGHETTIQAIKRGEEKNFRRQDIQEALAAKVARYRQPFQQLRIQYGQNRGKNFTEEEDRFLVCMLKEIGYESENCFERLRREVRNSPAFRFDWFIKSRTSTELQRRCTTLIALIEKEHQELAEKEHAEKKSSKRKSDSQSSGKSKKKR